ncbi:MAG TPA: DUF6491 family protein [Rhodanobacteraceae bacterium]
MRALGAMFFALASAGLLAGCVTSPSSTMVDETVAPARLANVHAAAGKPVASFNLNLALGDTSIYAWRALNNHELLVYTRPRQAWLLGLTPCPRLFRSPFIALTEAMGQVDHFSTVYVFRGLVPCQVRTIQPVDVGQLKVHMTYRMGATVLPRHGTDVSARR